MDHSRRGPLLIGAAVILPLLIFVAVLIAFSASERRRQVQEQAVAEASVLMIQVDASLSRTLGSLDALAALPAFVEGDVDGAYARSREIAGLNPDWVTVTFTDLDRATVLFDLRHPIGATLPSPQPVALPPAGWPEKAFAGGIGGTGRGCPCILTHRIVRGSNGHIHAVTAMVSPAPFQQLALAASGQNKLTGLVDREGDFIGRSIDFPERLGKPGSVSLRGAVASGKQAGIYSGRTLEGVANYTAFARSPLSGWSAHIAFAPTLLDVPRRRMIVAAGLASAAALALALFLIWFTIRQLREGRRVEERLQESQKLEALGQLTGGIAHDFNNLLTPILGGLDLLVDRGELDDRSRRLAEAALVCAKKASKLTGQLLAFSRRQRMEIHPVDLKALLAELEPLLRQSVDSSVEIEIHLDEEARCVLSDGNQLELALLNLVVNARDAMPAGGTIRIGASLRKRSPDEDPMVALTVEDSGVGMPAEVLRRAPEPFFTTKPPGSGTGLGLAQVHGIVEQSGGSLEMKSEVGKGTAVCIYLPACEAPPEVEPVQPGVGAAAPPGDWRILVCDDDDAVRGFVARAIEDGGYAVESVGNGRTAVEAIRNATYHLLVVDFAMQGMNGAEVARQVRSLDGAPPVLLITGYADTELLDQLGEGIPILRKPFDAETLLATVRQMVELGSVG